MDWGALLIDKPQNETRIKTLERDVAMLQGQVAQLMKTVAALNQVAQDATRLLQQLLGGSLGAP